MSQAWKQQQQQQVSVQMDSFPGGSNGSGGSSWKQAPNVVQETKCYDVDAVKNKKPPKEPYESNKSNVIYDQTGHPSHHYP
jgi:hypothetical protein